MTIEEVFSWVACVLVVTGITMLGHKRKAGFLVIAVGGMVTAVLVFLAENLLGLVAQNVIAVTTNIYSYAMWRIQKS